MQELFLIDNKNQNYDFKCTYKKNAIENFVGHLEPKNVQVSLTKLHLFFSFYPFVVVVAAALGQRGLNKISWSNNFLKYFQEETLAKCGRMRKDSAGSHRHGKSNSNRQTRSSTI